MQLGEKNQNIHFFSEPQSDFLTPHLNFSAKNMADCHKNTKFEAKNKVAGHNSRFGPPYHITHKILYHERF